MPLNGSSQSFLHVLENVLGICKIPRKNHKETSCNRCKNIHTSSIQPLSILWIVSHRIWCVYVRQNFQNCNFQEENTRESLSICTKIFVEILHVQSIFFFFLLPIDAYLFQVILVFHICQEALSFEWFTISTLPYPLCWLLAICTCIWCSILRRTVYP